MSEFQFLEEYPPVARKLAARELQHDAEFQREIRELEEKYLRKHLKSVIKSETYQILIEICE